jgi:Na+/melibiose symporter-like transporter
MMSVGMVRSQLRTLSGPQFGDAHEQVAMKNRTALLAALGVDNFGSGLFLPLALVYVTRVVGLPLGTAGALVSLGTLAGLAVPPVAGRLVDRMGPKPVVIAAQLLQALGALAYLAARAAPGVLAAAMLLAAGQQTFYSSLVALISDVDGSGPHDRVFAIVNMARSACFGLGGLVVAGVLTAAGPVALGVAVAADAGSFVACALMLALFVRLPRRRADGRAADGPGRGGVLANRPFLVLIAGTGLVVLAVDVFLTGTPVYVLEFLHAPPWLPGTMLALETALGGVAGVAALRATLRLPRLAAMRLGAALYVLWCAVSLAAALVPPGWRPAELLSATVVLAAAGLVFGPRACALAEAAAPPAARGRYLAAFQYAFTTAAILGPAVVALYSAAVWLPWAVTGGCAAVAIAGFRVLTSHLPGPRTAPPSPDPMVSEADASPVAPSRP